MNNALEAGIAATLSFLFNALVWANPFRQMIGNTMAEAFIFGGATVAITLALVFSLKKASCLLNASFSYDQRQPFASAAPCSAPRKLSSKETSGWKGKAKARPSSTRTRFTKRPSK